MISPAAWSPSPRRACALASGRSSVCTIAARTNARVRAARERPPLELTGLGVPGDSACDRRLHARGVFDFGHELVWRARTYEGVPGGA